MNYSKHYVAIASSKELDSGKPRRSFANGKALVVFRAADGTPRVYEDVCPHRGAMLSEGRIVNGELECPYHGWRFSADGQNTFVPVKNERVNCSLKCVVVKEAFGLVWAAGSKDAVLPALNPADPRAAFSGRISAKPENILENFLEGSHTHYVHDGYVRSGGKARQQIDAQLVPGPNGFEVYYQQERAKGWLTKLIPGRYRNLRAVSTFMHPHVAVLAYFNSEDTCVFRAEMILSPGDEGTEYHARVFLDVGIFTALLSPFLKPVLKKVIEQDRKILEQQERNLSKAGKNNFFSNETDTVGKQIFAWLVQPDKVATTPIDFKVWW